jgi:hypothetical protein
MWPPRSYFLDIHTLFNIYYLRIGEKGQNFNNTIFGCNKYCKFFFPSKKHKIDFFNYFYFPLSVNEIIYTTRVSVMNIASCAKISVKRVNDLHLHNYIHMHLCTIYM